MTSENKKKAPAKNICIGKIYADWCGHCKTLRPEWEKMKRFIKLNMGRNLKNVKIEFAEIGETNKTKAAGKNLQDLLDEFNQTHLSHSEEKVALHGGFPTLFKICDGRLEYYEGERRAETMYKWAMNKCGAKSDVKPRWRGGTRRLRGSKKNKKATRRLFSWF